MIMAKMSLEQQKISLHYSVFNKKLLDGDFYYVSEEMKDFIRENGDRNGILYGVEQLEREVDMATAWWKNGQPKHDDGLIMRKYFIPRIKKLWDDYVLLDTMSTHNNYLLSIRNKVRASGREWSWSEIRKRLESQLAHIAVMQLQDGNSDEKKERLATMYSEQARYRQQMFAYFVTELTLKEADLQELEELLLTPTVDNIDQRLIISALTINGLLVFDTLKTMLLLNVYRKAQDMAVRQYALVGWTLMLPRTESPGTEKLVRMVRKLVDSDQVAREEMEQLQIQLSYCERAEKDSRDFQKSVMPDIIKASNIKMTQKGIEIKEEDPMDDILGRSDTEKRMEEMEKKLRGFSDMRKKGMDIFFSGFKHMKNYPFFNDLCNWLTPFYCEHPDISAAIEKMGKETGIVNIMLDAPICDNDKYSFVFALLSIIDRMPKEIVDQLKSVPGSEMPYMDWMSDPAIIRRNYLQSLFRFFNLFPYASSFCNPFKDGYYAMFGIYEDDVKPANFAANMIFQNTRFEDNMLDLMKHFLRIKEINTAYLIYEVLFRGRLAGTFDLLYSRSLIALYQENYDIAWAMLKRCLEIRPDSVQVKKTLARSYFDCELFDDARDLYYELMQVQEGNRKWIFSYALCCDMVGDYEESKKTLYRLYYEYPDDKKVIILLAKALTMTGRAEESMKLVDSVDISTLDPNVCRDYYLVAGLTCLALDVRKDAVAFLALAIDRKYVESHGMKYSYLIDELNICINSYRQVMHDIYGVDDNTFMLVSHEVYKYLTGKD